MEWANGVGKTTAFNELIPKNVNYVNADLIAKQIREKTSVTNVQELANRETTEIFFKHVNSKVTFAVETNLHDLETHKSFMAVQSAGYHVEIFFMYVDDLEICNRRISNRVKQGGHFVRPDIVRQRYESSLKLLEHYFNYPDKLTLIDTSEGMLKVIALLEKGEIRELNKDTNWWAKAIIDKVKSGKEDKGHDSIEEIRARYRSKKI